jgi:hypothetical protein
MANMKMSIVKGKIHEVEEKLKKFWFGGGHNQRMGLTSLLIVFYSVFFIGIND